MNSKQSMAHNGVIYAAMDCQSIAHRRLEGDRQELRVLAELRRRIKQGLSVADQAEWLWNYNIAEDADHEDGRQAANNICRLLELKDNALTAGTSQSA